MLRKFCSVCGFEKKLTDFHKRLDSKDGRAGRCKDCTRSYHRTWEARNREKLSEKKREYYRRNPGVRAASSRKQRYGITPERFESMLASQNGACALCQMAFSGTPWIDHDHATGEVRGLLCPSCNTGLGHVERFLAGGFLDKCFKYLEGVRHYVA